MPKEYSLSNIDIDKIFKEMGEPKTEIFTYPELSNVRSIDELLDHKGRGIMLFLHTPKSGHWIGIVKKGNTLEVYDSYGVKPDNQQDEIGADYETQKQLGQDAPLLHEIAKRNGYTILYNKDKLQPMINGVNTCGRHAVMRVLFSDESLQNYKKKLRETAKRNGMSVDDLVYKITEKILGK